jgi:hypothetical protein
MTNDKAASLFTTGSRFMRLKDMTGLFAVNGNSFTNSNINTITFSSTVIKTGNFIATGVPAGNNVNKDSVSMSESLSRYEAGAY